jgi:hypothetical protein
MPEPGLSRFTLAMEQLELVRSNRAGFKLQLLQLCGDHLDGFLLSNPKHLRHEPFDYPIHFALYATHAASVSRSCFSWPFPVALIVLEAGRV